MTIHGQKKAFLMQILMFQTVPAAKPNAKAAKDDSSSDDGSSDSDEEETKGQQAKKVSFPLCRIWCELFNLDSCLL